jgi:hypothetical protein
MRPTACPTAIAAPNSVVLRGRFVKLTGFPCHRSDPYVGGEAVTFEGSDGSTRTIVTGSANWTGLAGTPKAHSASAVRWRPSPWSSRRQRASSS